MFYEVKVFDSQGQLKKVVSSKKLSSQFWHNNSSTFPHSEEGYVKPEEWNSKGNMSAEKVKMDESL